MCTNIPQIKQYLHGLKESKKDYYVHILGEEEMIKFMVIDAETEENNNIAYYHGRNFIQALKMLFSVPFKAVIVNINLYQNHGFTSNYEFCVVIREKLNRLKICYYFICSYQFLYLSIFPNANITSKIGDKVFLIMVGPSKDDYKHTEFEFTENGYKWNRIGRVCITSVTPFSPAKINGNEANKYSKIIICNIHNHPVTRLTDLFQTDNLIVVGNEQYNRSFNRYICEMRKWMDDKSAIKYHVCPYSAHSYRVAGTIGDVQCELIKAEIGDPLPIEKTVIVDKTAQSLLATSTGEDGHVVLENKDLDKECHKIEICFKVDDEHFHSLTTKGIIIPEIQSLPKTLDDQLVSKTKIPIIGFWDNSSVICVSSSKNGGKYKFLQSWNGLYGKELFINFSKQKASIDSKLMASDKTKMSFVVYDLIRIMSMSSDDIKKNEKWKFKFSNDSDNSILLEYDCYGGKKSARSPEFLMALLLKEHFKAIQAETGASENPKEIGFYFFDEFDADEKQRVGSQLGKSCELLKIQCFFLNV